MESFIDKYRSESVDDFKLTEKQKCWLKELYENPNHLEELKKERETLKKQCPGVSFCINENDVEEVLDNKPLK